MYLFEILVVITVLCGWGYICYIGHEIDKLKNEMQFLHLQLTHIKNHQNIG